MKLTKNTKILVLLAVILSGWTLGYEIINNSQKNITQTEQNQVFQFQETDIQKIAVVKPNLTLELVQIDSSHSWQIKQPDNNHIPANNGKVTFLTNLLVNGEQKRSFWVSPQKLAQYGLQPAKTKIIVFLHNNQTYQLALGKPGIEENTIYAQIISPLQNQSEVEVLLISQNWQYAVDPELKAWKL